jgi:glycosyltransferase involved in cell wall biosynthesis
VNAAPSQRFRHEHYLKALQQAGFQHKISPFMSERMWRVLYKKGNIHLKITGLIAGMFRRFLMLFTLGRYKYVYIHRETVPVGLPWVEWFIVVIARKRVIYDFDDSIWLKNYSDSNKAFAFMKRYRNVPYLCRKAWKVSAGNHILAAYASNYCKNVEVIPTVVDTENYHCGNRINNSTIFTIGWTGSHSTVQYLLHLEEVFKELEQKYKFRLLVISDREPGMNLKCVEYLKWNQSTEIEDLLKFDIGIMPLKDDMWSRGKCGFKAIQYMSLGIPAAVSDVGVNSAIVDNNLNGWICRTKEDWTQIFEKCLQGTMDLTSFGLAARKKIEDYYSVKANTNKFLHLFSDESMK